MFNYLHYRCSHPFSRPFVRDLWQMDEDGFGVSACGCNVVECGKVCPVADVQPCTAGGLCGDAGLYKAVTQFLYWKDICMLLKANVGSVFSKLHRLFR